MSISGRSEIGHTQKHQAVRSPQELVHTTQKSVSKTSTRKKRHEKQYAVCPPQLQTISHPLRILFFASVVTKHALEFHFAQHRTQYNPRNVFMVVLTISHSELPN